MVWLRHSLRVIAAICACIAVIGCATLPAPPSESLRETWGRQAIVPSRSVPQSNFRAFAVGKAQGTAKGAAGGTVMGLAWTGVYAATGPLQAILAPYVALVAVPVMATSGALAGRKESISEEDAAALDQSIHQSLMQLNLSDSLAKVIAADARQSTGRHLPLVDTGPAARGTTVDTQAFAQQGLDSMVDVDVSKIGFTGGKRLRFYLAANVSVIAVRSHERLYAREFVYQSDPYEAKSWAKDHAKLLEAELQRANASLAESVVEHLYLLTSLPLESRAGAGAEVDSQGLLSGLGSRDACGLAWVSPKHEYRPSIRDTEHRTWNRFPRVASRRPTLVWEAFPRAIDRRGANASLLSAIRDVRYDLRVWQVMADGPPKLVYERRGLPQPSHELEQPLLSGQRYFWSVRARFKLNGRIRATQWGYFRAPGYLVSGADMVKPAASPATVVGAMTAGAAPRDPCTLDFIPTANYYRFEVP